MNAGLFHEGQGCEGCTRSCKEFIFDLDFADGGLSKASKVIPRPQEAELNADLIKTKSVNLVKLARSD